MTAASAFISSTVARGTCSSNFFLSNWGESTSHWMIGGLLETNPCLTRLMWWHSPPTSRIRLNQWGHSQVHWPSSSRATVQYFPEMLEEGTLQVRIDSSFWPCAHLRARIAVRKSGTFGQRVLLIMFIYVGPFFGNV